MAIDNSRFSRIYIKLMFPFLIVRFFPQYIFYKIDKQRNLIRTDIENECQQYKIGFRMFILKFLWAFNYDPFFIDLFYYRIGSSKSSICNLTKKSSQTFMVIDGGGDLQEIKLYHPFSTIINAKRIGKNLQIRNGVTIGNTHESQEYRPSIGDNVNIGANSIIIGKITIGNNVTIGAGTLINKNIPDNAIVVGNPFRIVGFNENIRN